MPEIEGHSRLRLARAVYDFADHGGAIAAHTLKGDVIPDDALILGGVVEVITTCVTAGADAGTMAISVNAANDIVSAIAVNNGANPWDAGRQAIVPKFNTPESTAVKTTAARAIVGTIAGQVFTAGRFIVYLFYVASE
jgi:hypothetical protein